MQSNLKQTRRILEVLQLKRQLIEKTLAELNLKSSQIANKLERLSRRCDAPRLDDAAQISFAVAAQTWEVWRENERKALRIKQAELSGRAQTAQNALRVLIVQIETFERSHQLTRKQISDDFQADQSQERLEIWQATQPRS